MEDLRPIPEQICSFIQNKQNAYLSSVASDLALCMILNITYFQMSKEDLLMPALQLRLIQAAIRVLWQGGGIKCNKREDAW